LNGLRRLFFWAFLWASVIWLVKNLDRYRWDFFDVSGLNYRVFVSPLVLSGPLALSPYWRLPLGFDCLSSLLRIWIAMGGTTLCFGTGLTRAFLSFVSSSGK